MRIKRAIIGAFLGAGLSLAVFPSGAMALTAPTISSVYVTSMTVSWTPSGSVGGYDVVIGTSYPIIIVTASSSTYAATNTLTVVGLSSNTAYYPIAGDFPLAGGATSYIPTAPAYRYTLTSPLFGTSISQIPGGIQAFWTPLGTGNAAGYMLEVSTSPTFTPYATANNSTDPNANTLSVTGLTQGATYFVRVAGVNQDFYPNFKLIGSTVPGAAVSGSGLGTASIVPANAVQGGVQTTTITFTVPSIGMGVGGRIEIGVPANWYPYAQTNNPSSDNYVTVTTTGAATFSLTTNNTTSSSTVVAQLNSGFLSAGMKLTFVFKNIHPPCPQPGQTQAAWTVKSAMSASDSLATISSTLIENLVQGPAQWLNYTQWNPVIVAGNQPSSPLCLQIADTCGTPTVLASDLTIDLTGLTQDSNYNYISDANALFSTSSGFATSTTSIVIPALSPSATFYYKTSSVGNNLSIRGNYQGFGTYSTGPQQIWRSVTSLANAFSFGSPSVDLGSPVSGQTSVTLGPSGSGTSSFAYIRFSPSNTSLTWRVSISSNGFQTIVYDRWGNGDPTSTVFWDGRDMFRMNQPVPNGTYVVKLEIPGLGSSIDTSLSIIVASYQIIGTVRYGGSPISGANINAQGANTPGYSFASSDANGNYILSGLQSGKQYNLNVNYYDSVTQANVSAQMSNVTAPATGIDFNIAKPSVLRIAAVAPSSTSITTYGNLNIHTIDYSKNYFGNIRLLSGTTTSDNGDYFNSSTWTIVNVQPGTYVIHLNIYGYGSTDQTVTVATNQTYDIVMPLVTQASVFGVIDLSTPVANSTWISVEGVKTGNNYPTVWGGSYLNVGQSSAVYSMYAVDAGTYSFRARLPGYVPNVKSVVVGTTNLGNPVTGGGVDFNNFSTGGQISGSITINGDTSDLSSPLNLWLSAFSPSLGDNAFTQVQVSTSATSIVASYAIKGVANTTYVVYPPYLQGFQPSVPGPQSVTVSGGAGVLNWTLDQNSAQISGTVGLPSGKTDYSNVHLTLQGPEFKQKDLTASTYNFDHLGTGFYTLIANYRTTGAQKRVSFALTNGQAQTLNLDLSAPTRNVSGNVSIQSAFTMRGSSGTTVTINTIADLLANATHQTLYLGVNTLSTTTARVEAFPKTFNSFNAGIHTGFGNSFAESGYRFGVIDSNGNYSIAGLNAGLWEISVYPYLDNGYVPNVATLRRVVTVTSADITGIDFPLSNGYSVSGTIELPPGDTDNRTFFVQILSDRGDLVQSKPITLGLPGNPAASVSYSFDSLPSGKFTIVVQDQFSFDPTINQSVVKYVASPVAFTIASADQINVDVTMGRAARIIGKLGIAGTNTDGTPNLTLITSNNTYLLPSSFRIFAHADPWVPGGNGSATFGYDGRISIDSNNQFRITGLVPGTYNVNFRQDSFGLSIQGSGSLNLASYTEGSVVVAEGQTVDLGTISLNPGLSLSGTVEDQSGNPLSNIRIRAQAATDKHGSDGIEAFSDATGHFTLTGLNPDKRIYNIVAAPRPHGNDTTPLVPYGTVKKQAVDVTKVPAPTLDFVLPSATASLIGKVETVDSGALSYPSGGEQSGFPAAAIFMRLQGTVSEENPLGDDSPTDLDGSFSIASLVAGTYDITIESLGYRPLKLSGVTLSEGAIKNLGTITLQTGPSLTVTLAKPDGTLVNTKEVGTAVAVTPDLGSIIFGQINSDTNTNQITSIKFSGFELSPKTYNVLFFDKSDNIVSPSDGRGITFTDNDDVLSKSLTFQPSAPFAYVHLKKSGSDVVMTYYFSRPLRNSGADQDPTQWFSVLSGNVSGLSDHTLSGDRQQLTVTYTPTPGDQNARIRFSASTVDEDPSTGEEFILTKTVTLLLGQRSTAESAINPTLGGSVSLAQDEDPTQVSIPSNALLTSTGSAVDAGTSYSFTLTATEDADSISASPRRRNRAAALAKQMARGSAAYVSEAYAAMGAARASSDINPLSSFYSILLPAGLSHTLRETAYLTLSYDSDADPNLINIYYFDGTKYILESNQRSVDTVNHTITVGVSHFSTFVVLENSSQIIIVNGGSSSGGDIEVFNFPNPFDLQSKTKTLNHGGTTSSLTTDGTIIRYSIPASMAGVAHIDIYNVVGEKVRSIDLGSPATGTYNYVTWDGKNDAGRNVASGLYIGQLKVGGNKKFWKMAVIK